MSKIRVSVFRREEGFTLLEALIAMTIVSIALLATGSLLFAITGFNRHSRQRTAATTLAQDRLEEMKLIPYSTIIGGTTTETGLDEDGNTGGDAIYDRVIVIDDTSYPGMKTIAVTVNWNHMGDIRNVTLRSAVSK